MNREIFELLEQIAQEHEIPLQELLHTLENALAKAYKKHMGISDNAPVHVRIDTERSSWHAYCQKEVVGFVSNEYTQIALEEACRMKPDVEVGDYIEVEVAPEQFGRIAAQTALQVLRQHLREWTKKHAVEELRKKEGDVVTGVVKRYEGKWVLFSVGNLEVVLPPEEQVPTERYRFNERFKLYVLEVREREKGIRAVVSRTHPNLLRRLLEAEVPEIEEGLVEIKAVAREAGIRAKVAVASKNPRVDAVGACIGHRGMRIQPVTDELFGERIDVIPWRSDPVEFIIEALGPARVNRVILDEAHRSALVVVPNNQLSLAIGKNGTNVRLASKLTGWKLDVRTEAQLAAEKGSKTPSVGDEKREQSA